MRNRSFAFLLALIAVGCSGSGSRGAAGPAPAPDFSPETFQDPPAEFRPWVRWWWPGGDVEDAELAREIGVLADNGFGGAEIQPFDAALDPKADAAEIARRRSFDTPEYYARLRAALAAARDAGIAVDLTFGSGWPAGGASVAPEDSLQTLLWTERTVEGPANVVLDLSAPNRPVFYDVATLVELFSGERLARYEGARAEIVEVLAARVTGGGRSGNPLNLTDAVELDPTSVQILTDLVGADGVLRWNAPPGRWQAVAVFRAPDGEFPLLVAQPDPGYVVDHLDAGLVTDLLARFLEAPTGLAAFHGDPIRAVFSDSLEWKCDRLASRDVLAEFAARRGYDLRPRLPAVLVPGADNNVFELGSVRRGPEFRFSEDDARIRWDYGQTLTDLFAERFAGAAGAWLAARGMALRAQNYGADFDAIRASAAAQIPETEALYAGGSETFLKIVSAAAHLYGRSEISAESMVWLGRAYMETPLKWKAAADKLFASGVNRVIFHGLPYRKDGSAYPPETGWHPFSSPFAGLGPFASDVSERAAYAPWMADVNRYIARLQYAMRRGEPAADVLVYYPWLGFPAALTALEGYDEFLFNGRFDAEPPETTVSGLIEILRALGLSETDPRAAWVAARKSMLDALSRSGFSWTWANDDSLAEAEAEGGGISIRGRRFEAVVIAEAGAMEREAAEALADAAREGAAVFLAGAAPTRQAGFRDLAAGDAAVLAAMAAIRDAGRGGEADEGEIVAALAAGDVRPEIEPIAGGEFLRHARRDLGEDGRAILLTNEMADRAGLRLRVRGGCERPVRADAWTGSLRAIAPEADGSLAVPLAGYGSALLLCGVELEAEPPAAEEALLQIFILGPWTLEVAGEDVPGGAVALDPAPLADWREIPELRFSSSPGVYRTAVTLPALAEGRRAILRVGRLQGVATVRVNGQEAGDLLLPPFEADVTALVREGANDVELRLTPPLRNRLVGKGRSGDARYVHFAGPEDALGPAGVTGGVSIEIRR